MTIRVCISIVYMMKAKWLCPQATSRRDTHDTKYHRNASVRLILIRWSVIYPFVHSNNTQLASASSMLWQYISVRAHVPPPAVRPLYRCTAFLQSLFLPKINCNINSSKQVNRNFLSDWLLTGESLSLKFRPGGKRCRFWGLINFYLAS